MPENPRLASRGDAPAPKAKQLGWLDELGIEVKPAAEEDDDPDARGVVVTRVEDDGEAAAKGISRGDRILRVGGIEVNSPEELDDALTEAREDGLPSVHVLIRFRNGSRFVSFELART